jgi:hypothetical protein
MEAFNKHIQKQQFALLEYSAASRDGIIAMQKIGWKAALEWALDHIQQVDLISTIEYLIKEELKDE